MGEYIITIKGGQRVRIDNGPIKRFGRSRYLSRRNRMSHGPFIVAFDTIGGANGLDSTLPINDSALVPSIEEGDWPYGLRIGDIVAIMLWSPDGFTIPDSGWTIVSNGSMHLAWKRWDGSLPQTVTFTIGGAEYDPGDPGAIPGYIEGFYVVLRNVKDGTSPFVNIKFKEDSGPNALLPSLKANGTDDLVLGFVRSEAGVVGDFFTSMTNPKLDDTTVWDQFASGFAGDGSATYGFLAADAPKGGAVPESTIACAESAAFHSMAVSLAKGRPKEAFTGIYSGPSSASRDFRVVKDDIVIVAEVSGNTHEGWTLIPESVMEEFVYADTSISDAKFTHRLWWKRWTEASVPIWDVYAADTDATVIVVRNAARSGDPFIAKTFTHGWSTTAATGAVNVPKGTLVIPIVRAHNGGSVKYRLNETSLERFENIIFMTQRQCAASGYQISSGSTGSFTANMSSSQQWFTSLLALRKA